MRGRNYGGSSDGPEPVSRIIGKVFATGKFGECAQVAQLWGQWTEIVGEDIAAHCVPEKISGGKLYVSVDSPVWCQQLDLLKEELKEKIDRKLQDPGIKKIVFRSTMLQ
ncbi:MAG: DUF721 domain-containing protein [Candidatus Hydrogenedentota bacterium]|nr:MAG: DUF721 domain-containing protein [Candidatus Hydrogenedentota bacterium]